MQEILTLGVTVYEPPGPGAKEISKKLAAISSEHPEIEIEPKGPPPPPPPPPPVLSGADAEEPPPPHDEMISKANKVCS